MDETKKKLLGEFDGYRWHLMTLLADRCEELGHDAEALGWRWMAKRKSWPTPGGRFMFYREGQLERRPKPHHLPADAYKYLDRSRSKNLNDQLHKIARAIGAWLAGGIAQGVGK